MIKFIIYIISVIITLSTANNSVYANESESKIELHWSICDYSTVDEIIKKLNFFVSESEFRYVEYMDTPVNLDFYHKGIVVRIRGTTGIWQSTLKIKQETYKVTSTQSRILSHDKKNSKCEYDRVGDNISLNCSYNSQIKKGGFPNHLNEALNGEQLAILKQNFQNYEDYDQLRSTGLIPQNSYKLTGPNNENFDLEVTNLGEDGQTIIQLSLKTTLEKSEKIYARWKSYFLKSNINLCDPQKSKTQTILENIFVP